MKRLLVILICYGLTAIPAVSSLMCETCSAENAPTCSGAQVTCDPSVTSCISSLVEATVDTLSVKVPLKSCGLPDICNISYSITLNNIHIASDARCCQSDGCNKDVPHITPRNLTKNGLICPYCLESGLKGCTPTNRTPCTGLEDRCIKFSGYLGFGETPKETSYQGCATSSACLTNQKSSSNETNGVGISCTKAARHGSEEGVHPSVTNSTVPPTSQNSRSSGRGPR